MYYYANYLIGNVFFILEGKVFKKTKQNKTKQKTNMSLK